MPQLFRLAGEVFLDLSAGRGSPDTIRFLLKAEWSRRLLLITEAFNAAEKHPDLPGPLHRFDAAGRMLTVAQVTAPARFERLLLDPQVGAWIAYTMRRQTSAVASNDVPLWVDFGGLNVLALVAAAQAGLPWQTRLPHRHGNVLLFGMGMARFPGIRADELVEAETAAGRITLKAAGSAISVSVGEETDHDQWWHLRWLHAGTEPGLSACLDDLDPNRDLADPVDPDRLNNADARRWQALLSEAWDILCLECPETATAMAHGVVSLVPLPLGDGRETRSASSGESFGRVMASPPPDGLTLAVTLVHEFQHIKLGGLMHLIMLTEDNEDACLYAPWRDDPRPVGGLLQGIYAFFGIAEFWRSHRSASSDADLRLTDFEYAYARRQASDGVKTVREADKLTDLGREFVDELSARLETWQSDDLDSATAAAVHVVADHHRAGWRVRHQRVRDTELNALTHAWLQGGPAILQTGAPEVASAPAVRWSFRLIELARRRILEPESWKAFGVAADGRARLFRTGDVALFDGDTETAVAAYTELVRQNHTDFDAWSGLTVAMMASGNDHAARALSRRPELVRALYSELVAAGAAPEPIRVADWLGSVMTGI